jgi:hypothetical protein
MGKMAIISRKSPPPPWESIQINNNVRHPPMRKLPIVNESTQASIAPIHHLTNPHRYAPNLTSTASRPLIDKINQFIVDYKNLKSMFFHHVAI